MNDITYIKELAYEAQKSLITALMTSPPNPELEKAYEAVYKIVRELE